MTVREQLDAAWEQMKCEHGMVLYEARVDMEIAKLIFSTGYIAGANDQLELDKQKFSEIVAGATP